MESISTNFIPATSSYFGIHMRNKEAKIKEISKIALKIFKIMTLIPPITIGIRDTFSNKNSEKQTQTPLIVKILISATLVWPFLVGVQKIWSEIKNDPYILNLCSQLGEKKLQQLSDEELFQLLDDDLFIQNLNISELQFLLSEKFSPLEIAKEKFPFSDNVSKKEILKKRILTSLTAAQCNEIIMELQKTVPDESNMFMSIDTNLIAELFDKSDNNNEKQKLFASLWFVHRTKILEQVLSTDFLTGNDIGTIFNTFYMSNEFVRNKVLRQLTENQIEDLLTYMENQYDVFEFLPGIAKGLLDKIQNEDQKSRLTHGLGR